MIDKAQGWIGHSVASQRDQAMVARRRRAQVIGICLASLCYATWAIATDNEILPSRVEIRIAASKSADADLIQAALKVDKDITFADGREVRWTPFEREETATTDRLDIVTRDGSILVLIDPDDVDTEVESVLHTRDQYGHAALRLLFPTTSSSRLEKLSRDNLGRVAVIVVEGRAVQIGRLASPLRSVCVPAGAVSGIVSREGEAVEVLDAPSGATTVAFIGALTLMMSAAILVAVRLRKTRVSVIRRIAASAMGALAGVIILCVLNVTGVVVPTAETTTAVHILAILWLGSCACVGGTVGYSVSLIIYAWRQRHADI